MTTFAELGLSAKVLAAVTDAGYTEPTPIQAGAIPHAIAGKDVLGVVLHTFATLEAPISGGDARRLIQHGSIQLNGEKLTDPKAEPAWNAGDVLKLDKKRTVRLRL